MISLPLSAMADGDNRLERLMADLATANSGSASMNLLLQRATDAREAGNSQQAIEHLTALTDHAPDFAEGWQMLAVVLFEQQRFGQSADALERALALNPQHFGAMRGLGAILEQVGKPTLAYQVYKRVLDLHPHDADVLKAVDRLQQQVDGTSL